MDLWRRGEEVEVASDIEVVFAQVSGGDADESFAIGDGAAHYRTSLFGWC